MLPLDSFNYVEAPFMDLEQLYLNREVSSAVMDELKIRRERNIVQSLELAMKYNDYVLLPPGILPSYVFRCRLIQQCIQAEAWNVYPWILGQSNFEEICNQQHYQLLEDTNIPTEVLGVFTRSLRQPRRGRPLVPSDILPRILLQHMFPTAPRNTPYRRIRIIPFQDNTNSKLLKAEKIVISYLLQRGYSPETFLECKQGVKNSIYCHLLSEEYLEFSKIPKDSLFAIYQQMYNEQLLTKKLVVDLLFHCYVTSSEQQLYLQMHWMLKYCGQVGIQQ